MLTLYGIDQWDWSENDLISELFPDPGEETNIIPNEGVQANDIIPGEKTTLIQTEGIHEHNINPGENTKLELFINFVQKDLLF